MKKKEITLSCVACLLLLSGCTSKEKTNDEPLKVGVYAVKEASTADGHSYVGTIEESEGTMLSFAGMGTVNRTFVEEGQAVKQGQLLATLDPQTARNAHNIALATLKQAQDAYRRMKQLHDAQSITEMQWVQIETQLSQAVSSERMARKSLNDCALRAPFSGYISQKQISEGSNVAPGVPCFKLVKIDQVKVKVAIPEKEIAHVKKGDRMTFTVSALDGKSFFGVVAEKGVQSNVLSHTYDVKLSLGNPRHELFPGMVCSVKTNIEGASRNSLAIILPQEAVLTDEKQQFVWIAENGKAVKRIISVGDICNEGVIVTSGLNVGDNVIIGGKDEVSEGSKVIAK